jgi:hypothetical protein
MRVEFWKPCLVTLSKWHELKFLKFKDLQILLLTENHPINHLPSSLGFKFIKCQTQFWHPTFMLPKWKRKCASVLRPAIYPSLHKSFQHQLWSFYSPWSSMDGKISVYKLLIFVDNRICKSLNFKNFNSCHLDSVTRHGFQNSTLILIPRV